MKTYTLTESQLRELVTESTKNYLVNEGLWNSVKQGAKMAGIGALGTVGLAGLDLANSEINSDAQEDPVAADMRQATDEFRYDNLMDKVKNGDISHEDAMDLYKQGKGYNESRRINRKLQTESFRRTVRNIINRVIKEGYKR
jgi:hypothetical protein